MTKPILTYILIGIVLIACIGILISCNSKFKKETIEKKQQSEKTTERNPYMDMRQMALNVTAEQLGFQIPEDSIKVY